MRHIAAFALCLACIPSPLVEGPPEVATLRPTGLYTSPNEHGEIPPGGLSQAQDVVLNKDKVIEKRRGQGPALGSGAEKLWPYSDRLLVHSGSTLGYTDTGVTTKTDYAATIAAVAGRRLRAATQNRNAYLATAAGVKRLDAVTTPPVDAGVPMGLDVQASLTGTSGFLANDSAVAYRAVWGYRDANGNLLLGAPSGRAVISNSAGGTRDTIVSTSIPAGLSATHFWQLYRTANAVTAATDPGDEMGLVYEATVPQAAAVTQLARATNVVTATTGAAHGFSIGQIVRVSPGGSPSGTLAAIGTTSVAATSTDGITWTSRTIPTGNYNAVTSSGPLYVAVGGSVCATSPDGVTWTSRTIPAGTYQGVAWTGSLFVAVGNSIAATSPDGITWTSRTIPAASYQELAWNGSTLVAVGANNKAATSPDGITWTARTLPGAASVTGFSVVWIGSVFVAVGTKSSGSDGWAATSPDGVTWTERTIPTGSYYGVAWNGSVVAATGVSVAATSPDGITWTSRTIPAGTYNGVAWNSPVFAAVGNSVAATSPDGVTWTSRTIPAGTYTAVALGGTPGFPPGEFTIASTPTGTTFTYAQTGADGTLTQAQTATPLTATVVDQIPSTFAGATLYTSPSQDGILASQYEPPLCVDLALYRGSMFWLGTTDRALLDFWLLASGSPSGVQANDTVTVNSTVFTAKASESIGAREFQVFTAGSAATNVRDTAASLIRVLNRAQGSPVYARDSSSANEQPGHIELTARARTDPITISVSRASAFALSSGTTRAPESNPHRLAWSQEGRPDAATVTGYVNVGDRGRDALRVIALRDSLFVLKEDGVWRATGDRFDHQTPPALSPFDTTTEIVAPESAVVLDNTIFALSTKGIVQISDTGVTIISRPIEDQIRYLLVEPLLSTVRTLAHAVAYEADGRYILWVPSESTDTQATRAFVYDHFASLATGTPVWTVRSDAAQAAVVNPYDGKLYVGTSLAVTRERKNLDFTDFADGEVSVSISSATGASVTLASASGVAEGDMLVQGTHRGVVLLVATNTLTLDRTWAGTTGAATAYKAIPSSFEFAPFIPAPGSWTHFKEAAFLFRWVSGGYMSAEFATELTRSVEFSGGLPLDLTTGYTRVDFYGTRDYGLLEDVPAATNLRTWIPKNDQKSERLMVRFNHNQAMCPMAFEGVAITFAPIGTRLRR